MMNHRLGVCSFLFLTCAFVCGFAAQRPTAQQIAAWQRDPEVIRDFKMGRELRRTGKLAEAAAAYDRVLKRAPGLALAYLNPGLVRHDQQDYAASTENFSKAVSLDSGLLEAQLYWGIDAYLWGKYDMARKALEEATRIKPDNAETFYWLGLTQAAISDLRGAAGSLETAVRLKPKDEDALYQLQEVYLQLWKSTYDRLVAADPDSYRIHQILAEGFLQSDRLDEARREYQTVLKVNPSVAGVHEALGDIARRQQQSGLAREQYQAELELSLRNPGVWYKLAEVLIDQGEYLAAADGLQKCLDLDVNFAPTYCGLGRLAQNQGHPDTAVSHFQRALSLGLGGTLKETAHYQLFRLFQASGNTSQANHHKEEFLRLEKARKERALSVAERERKGQQLP